MLGANESEEEFNPFFTLPYQNELENVVDKMVV
jgi:hypothetical protein